MKIQTNFVLLLVTFIIIPQVFLAVGMVLFSAQTIDRQIIVNAKESLAITAVRISEIIGKIQDFSLELAVDPITQDLVRNRDSLSANRIDWLKNNLDSNIEYYAKVIPEIYSLSIYLDRKPLYQKGPDIGVDDKLYGKTISLAGEPFWIGTTYRMQEIGMSGPPLVSLYRAVNNIDFLETLGAERISFPETVFAEIFAKVPLWENETSLIYDSTYQILSSSDKNLPGRFITEYVDVHAISAEDGYLPSLVYGTSAIKHAFFVEPVPDTDWVLVRGAPVVRVFRVRYTIRNFIIGSVTIYLVFGLLFFLIQERILVVPLRRLASELSKTTRWKFDIDPTTMPNNELRQLSITIGKMTVRMHKNMKQIFSLKNREQEARLNTLESHINPHFLFNTLDSIRWLAVRNKDEEVGRQLESLSDIFVHILNRGNEETAVKDEITHIRNYMSILRFRFGDRMKLLITSDPAALDIPCLKLILQPLVENAVTHGLERRGEGGIVNVEVSIDQGTVTYIVRDNGIGADQQAVRAMLEGKTANSEYSALKNICERLRLQYGESAGLEFSSIVNTGTVVTVRFPARMEKSHEAADSRR